MGAYVHQNEGTSKQITEHYTCLLICLIIEKRSANFLAELLPPLDFFCAREKIVA
jgi:hypothetical protein